MANEKEGHNKPKKAQHGILDGFALNNSIQHA